MADPALRTLVLGGARSGKSQFAEQLAAKLAGDAPVRYFATAVRGAQDADFSARIAAHQARRPAAWITVEGAEHDLAQSLSQPGLTLIDDIGGWLTAQIDARDGWDGPRGAVAPATGALLQAIQACPGPLVLVSPEVGTGVVPASAAGRLFRDELGELNQRLAQACDTVVFVTAGLPAYLKQAPAAPALSKHNVPHYDSVSAAPPPTVAATPAAAVTFAAIAAPDNAVLAAAQARQAQLTKPAGSLGRLEELGNWVAACQGACPPQQFTRARVVIFAGDHGVAARGVSAFPSAVTQQMVANFAAGGAAVNALAAVAGATVRVADIAVDGDTAAEIAQHKVRRGSGSIDVADALTPDEVQAALRAGRAIADEEIDSGADLLIAGDMGIGNTTPATVLIAALTNTEPVAVLGRGTGIDDAGWIRKAAAVRDALRRARPVVHNPVELVRVAGGADFAALAAFLAQAAARRTPVLLDGVVIAAAALLAEDLAAGARQWWVAGHRSAEPAHRVALEQLRLKPLLEYEMRLGEGSGALAALPVLRAAVAALADMATFADAGVSQR